MQRSPSSRACRSYTAELSLDYTAASSQSLTPRSRHPKATSVFRGLDEPFALAIIILSHALARFRFETRRSPSKPVTEAVYHGKNGPMVLGC